MVGTRKYRWTPELHELLRAAYRAGSRREQTAGIDRLVRATGWPRHAAKCEARRLGITVRGARKAWTRVEDEFLQEALGVQAIRRIARKLGRSVESVEARGERLALSRRAREGYNETDLARCFGVSSTTVARWMRTGLLGPVHYCGGHRVAEKSVARFIKRFPGEYDLRRVDGTWFKGMVFGWLD